MHRIIVLLAILALAACTPPPDGPPPRQHGTCTHYQTGLQMQEGVPNCDFRSQHVLINGLPPANPGNKS